MALHLNFYRFLNERTSPMYRRIVSILSLELIMFTSLAVAQAPVKSSHYGRAFAAGQWRKLGWKPDIGPFNLDPFFVPKLSAAQLPDSAATDCQPPIQDQGQEGSCTGFGDARESGASLIRQKASNFGSPIEFPSAAFIYYNTRLASGDVTDDSGATIHDTIAAIAQYGVCRSSAFPYVAGDYAVKPPAAAYSEAACHKGLKYWRVTKPTAGTARTLGPNEIAAIESAIAQNYPVVFGITLHESFEHVGADGIVPIPGPGDPIIGGPCMVVTGYFHSQNGATASAIPSWFNLHFWRTQDATKNLWITVANSWGPSCGNHGYYYFPASMISKYASDFWVIQTMQADPATTTDGPSSWGAPLKDSSQSSIPIQWTAQPTTTTTAWTVSPETDYNGTHTATYFGTQTVKTISNATVTIQAAPTALTVTQPGQ